MKNLQNFLVEDNNVFGPGTDLVVSLAAVLIILIAVNANSFHQKLAEQEQIIVKCQELQKKYHDCEAARNELENIIKESEIGQIDIKEVKKNQMEIVNKIADKYGKEPLEIDKNRYDISTRGGKKHDIVIQNDVTIQRISFGSHILFDIDKTELKENGKQVLTRVGNIFKEKLGAIQEIQIQGHADPQQSRNFSSNLELAAHRAIEVFQHFQGLGIDPTRHIMSATSFGEYKPVQRKYSDMDYNSDSLRELQKNNLPNFINGI
jgi:flagellar motor protein MotB